MSDSLGNGRFDIPDFDQLEDESFPPLPPPHSPGLGEDNPFEDGDGDQSKLEDVPAAKRKTIRRPQPKLDSQRLTSERGLPALRTLFENVRFKGKGHEAEDLRVIMQKMENWAHRLFPKLQFDDFIDKVEKLGSKKDVQTCLKRIRLDMPLTHEDFIGRDGEEEAAPVQHVFEDPDPFDSIRGFPGGSQGPFHSTPAPVHSTPAPVSSTPAPVSTPPAPTLTEEQRRRIELNKQLALERRLARKRQQTELTDSPAVSALDVSFKADSAQADAPQADSAQADSAKTDPSQADSSQADSSQADSSPAVSSQADPSQAHSSQAHSCQADTAQADTAQADSSPAVSTQADSSQADTIQADSAQACAVHQPPASSPLSEPSATEPGPEESEGMDLDLGPMAEHPDNATDKDFSASLASPQPEEGEPSQPGS